MVEMRESGAKVESMGQQAKVGLCARRPEVEPVDPCTKVGMETRKPKAKPRS